jgi:hypothetical protein
MISPEVVNFSPPKSLQQTYTLKKEQALHKVPSQDLGSHFHGVRIKSCEDLLNLIKLKHILFIDHCSFAWRQ